ncbi:hypothetical protein [Streptomyces sp. NBC_01537]|uniref:hypothetical protein n=1 Tax=Streptomyces sp. NBC_01537 TaxID=2903896 RepID=UPI00386AFAB7
MSTPTYAPAGGGWNQGPGQQGPGPGQFPGQTPGQMPGRPSHLPSQGPGPDEQLQGPPRRLRPGFGLRGPRRDRHVLPADSLGALSVPVGDDGVVIGVDPQNHPAVLGIARPTPLDVVVVGSMWIAQLVALRTVAVGARVAVETARPPAWAPMAQAAGGGQQSVTVHEVRQLAPQGPSVTSPVLVVRDCGARPPRSLLAPSPWQSLLTLLPFLGPDAPRLLGRADLIGLQRLSPEETEVVTRVLRLPRQVAAALPTLGDNVLLWCTKDRQQFVMTQPTDAETGLLGAPRRMD